MGHRVINELHDVSDSKSNQLTLWVRLFLLIDGR